MQLSEEMPQGSLKFPLPWASEEACSFVEKPTLYKECARNAGLELLFEDDKTVMVLDLLDGTKQALATNPLALHILMGESVTIKMRNLVPLLKGGLIGPIQLLFRKPE